MKTNYLSPLSALLLLSSACGGGGSDDIVIQGRLIQAEEESHGKSIGKHGSNEPIEDVTICALGECSVTDSEGQWGFGVPVVPAEPVLFSVDGHGITDQIAVTLPQGKRDITIEMENHGKSEIHIHEVMGE